MNINEITELNYEDTPEERDAKLAFNDNEYHLTPNPVNWVRLHKYYNWDNIFNEVLYFYKIDLVMEKLYAISCGETHDGIYYITEKIFTFDYKGILAFAEFDYEDPWEIEEGELELSDSDSLGDVIIHIFEDGVEVDADLKLLSK